MTTNQDEHEPKNSDARSADTGAAPGSASRVLATAPDRLLTDYRLRQRDYLLRIVRAMNTRRGLPDVLQLVIRSAVRMTNGEAGAIAMQPAAGGDLQIVASYRLEGRFEHDLGVVLGSPTGDRRHDNKDPDGAGATSSADPSVAHSGHVGPAGEITIGSTAPRAGTPVGESHDPRSIGSYESDESYDMLTLPLELADETVGQILVFRTEGAAAFTPLDTEVLQAFADQAAVAVRNAHLHDQLAARERELREVVERNPGGIVLAGADGRVAAMNPAAQAIVGRGDDGARGLLLTQVLALEDDRGSGLSLSLPRGGATAAVRGYLRLPDDTRGPFVQVAVRGLCGPGDKVDSYLADIADLSSYKEAEDAKTAFLAGLSHELKTPLALIQGYAETLQLPAAQDDPAVFDESVGVILEEADHLNRMVDELLLAARLQSGTMRLDFDLVNLGELLRRLVDAFRVARPDRDWSIEVARDMPPITADPVRMRQVFQNLLSNAAKYTDPHDHIVVRVQPAAEGVLVGVHDEGMGIEARDHERIFERFVRATDRAEGAGLGLWMSRAIVDAHGGSISVQSEPGRGSTFDVFLPLEPDTRQAAAGSGVVMTQPVAGCGQDASEDQA